MKRLSFIIGLLIIPISYSTAAQHKNDIYFTELKKIALLIDSANPEFKRALQVCADKGNYYCSMGLGETNAKEENYIDAISNFKQCSEKCDGWCDFGLGIIYYEGIEVLQNDEKAIFYFKKAANLGLPNAAYNLAAIYEDKKSNGAYRYSDEGAKQYSNYAILEYAWLKIAMALGRKDYISKIDGKIPIAKVFDARKFGLASDGLLQQGDNMATQICSKNKFCKK